jgi:hypothetical protein
LFSSLDGRCSPVRKKQLITLPAIWSDPTEFNSTIINISKKFHGYNAPENSSSEKKILFTYSSTAVGLPTNVPKATVNEYELMEVYAKDAPLKVEPARFKRILLWNEVLYSLQYEHFIYR